jgi:ribosomal protein S18 acetylase RimI-like enzyme
VLAGLRELAERGASEAQVVTQERNSSACDLYTRCGFNLVAAQPRYHKWYPQPAS